METTRHFVATVYVVVDGAVPLHHHDRLDMWLPPGGHVDRDELPHQAARRECLEETGLAVDLLAPTGDVDTARVRSLPEPAATLLEDIDVHPDGRVAHQHVDFVYFGTAPTREIRPAGDDEAPPDAWRWFDPAALDEWAERLEPDVHALAHRAIETANTGG
jgi:8-oxo-dGTP pyrophosphatase MutT (NUDIX family)